MLKIEQQILRSLICPGTHPSRSARYPVATRKMYQGKISQIKFYYGCFTQESKKHLVAKQNKKYCGRSSWHTFFKIWQLIITLLPLAKFNRIRYQKSNSTTVGILKKAKNIWWQNRTKKILRSLILVYTLQDLERCHDATH